MDDLIRRKDALNATKMVYIECIYVDEEGYEETEMDGRDVVFKSDILALPAVDAVEANIIRRILNSECVRLYRADEEMLERMGGYNPSSFMAGFQYALDCVVGKFTQIK